MLDWLTAMTTEATALMRGVVVLIAIATIAIVWYQTKALVPVLSSVLVAAVALWAVSPAGITQIEQWIGNDSTRAIGPILDDSDPDPDEPILFSEWAGGAGSVV